MENTHKTSFSKKWMVFSMIVFIGVELILGGIIGNFLIGRFTSIGLSFFLKGILYLLSFFIGGLLIGLVSPGIRMAEPAIGAFLSVALMLGLTIFTPYRFIQFSLTKMLIGGGMALLLALYGAYLGEKMIQKFKKDRF
jgi:hypothetical protein